MTWTDPETLRAQTAARAGDSDLARAGRAITATVEALASSLSPDDARALAAELPRPFSDAARRRGARHIASPDAFDALARREGSPLGVAVEYAHVVCQILAEQLDPDTRDALHRHLPSPWRELFHPRPRDAAPPAPPHRAPPPGAGHTLATGRPGSRHPVSEAAAAPAQSESIAASDNPHGHDKLSSGAERTEPVSSSHPSTGRPLSEADS